MNNNLNKLVSNISALTEHTSKYIINEILNKNLYVNEPHKFVYTLLFKTNNGLDTANLLFSNLYSKPHLIDSTFLILRTILSDCITYDYLLTISNNDLDFIKNINRLYYDHISYTYNNLSIYSDAHKDSQDEREAKRLELRLLKSEYFDKDGKPVYLNLNVSASKAIKYIISNRKKNMIIDYPLSAFHYYDIFSKYEHLGDTTFFLTHRQFSKKATDDIISEFHHSVNIITHYMKTFMLAFESKDSTSYENFCILKSSIENTY